MTFTHQVVVLCTIYYPCTSVFINGSYFHPVYKVFYPCTIVCVFYSAGYVNHDNNVYPSLVCVIHDLHVLLVGYLKYSSDFNPRYTILL